MVPLRDARSGERRKGGRRRGRIWEDLKGRWKNQILKERFKGMRKAMRKMWVAWKKLRRKKHKEKMRNTEKRETGIKKNKMKNIFHARNQNREIFTEKEKNNRIFFHNIIFCEDKYYLLHMCTWVLWWSYLTKVLSFQDLIQNICVLSSSVSADII